MKTIILPIYPNQVQKILSGEKTIEVKKTAPKCELPFKVLMYCTKHKHFALVQGGGETSLFYAFNPYTAFIVGGELANGKVVGEFICDKVDYINSEKDLYGYHITAVKAYDKPKELVNYGNTCDEDEDCRFCEYKIDNSSENGYDVYCGCNCFKPITKAPKNYIYVEEDK